MTDHSIREEHWELIHDTIIPLVDSQGHLFIRPSMMGSIASAVGKDDHPPQLSATELCTAGAGGGREGKADRMTGCPLRGDEHAVRYGEGCLLHLHACQGTGMCKVTKQSHSA